MGLGPLREKGMMPEQVVGELAASCGLIQKGENISAKELAQRYRNSAIPLQNSAFSLSFK